MKVRLFILLFLVLVFSERNSALAVDWSHWVPIHSGESSSGNQYCWVYATCSMVEGLLNYQHQDSLGINLDESQLYSYNGNPDLILDKIKTDKVRSKPGGFPNYTNAYWAITAKSKYANSTQAIKSHLASSPVLVELDRSEAAPGADHLVVIVDYDDNTQKYKIKDPDNDDAFTYLGYHEYGIDNLSHWIASVDASCLAKICTDLMSLSDAMDYRFVSDEWAYIKGSCSGDITIESGEKIQGLSGSLFGSVTFTNASNAILKDVYVYNYSPSYTAITVNGGSYSTKLINVRSRNRVALNYSDPYMENVQCYQYDYKYGMDAYHSSPSLSNFRSTTDMKDPSDAPCIYSHRYSGPTMTATLKNKYKAIYVRDRSYVTVKYTDFCQNEWDIYAEWDAWDSDAYEYNVFSAPDPSDCIYGDVNLPPEEDWEWCGLAKIPVLENNVLHELNTADFTNLITAYHHTRFKLLHNLSSTGRADVDDLESEYRTLIQSFMQIVSSEPASEKAAQALTYLSACYTDLEQYQQLHDYLMSLLHSTTYQPLRQDIFSLLVSNAVRQQNAELALDYSNRFLAEFSQSEMVIEVLYGKVIIYKHYMNNDEQAAAIFVSIIEQYPEHATAKSAYAELATLESPLLLKSPVLQSQSLLEDWNTQVVVVPNPYSVSLAEQNPDQKLQFLNLPLFAVIHIYDVSGQRIRSFTHSVSSPVDFHTLQVPSGVYLYVVEELNTAGGNPTGKRAMGKFVVIQ